MATIARAFMLARLPCLGLALAAIPLMARAELGGRAEPFASGSMVAVSRSVDQRGNYAIRTTLLGSGTRITEYVAVSTRAKADSASSTEPVVFALAWSGPFLPDLKVLLGAHFDSLAAESGTRSRAGQSGITVNQPEVVIRSGGRMRAFAGRAWLPTALPPGFDVHDLD